MNSLVSLYSFILPPLGIYGVKKGKLFWFGEKWYDNRIYLIYSQLLMLPIITAPISLWALLKSKAMGKLEEYKKFEKSIKNIDKPNLTLYLAYMRLRYFKGLYKENRKYINNVGSEAEKLLNGKHELFPNLALNKEVQKFLLSLKSSIKSVELHYHWGVLLAVCFLFTILYFIFDRNSDQRFITAIIGGPITGTLLYHFLLIRIWHHQEIIYNKIPIVPLIIS